MNHFDVINMKLIKRNKLILSAAVLLILLFITAEILNPGAITKLLATAILGVLVLGFAPVIDFADQSAHQPDGGNFYWLERIDKTTGAVVTLGGQITAVKVTSVGSGYTSAPAVEFTGGGGTGAAGTAVVQNQKIVSVIITNSGSGYSTAPSVTFTGGGGTGAAGTAYVSDGWHKGPGRASHEFESGQEETEVRHEGNGIWDTKKEPQKGKLIIKHLQMDVWTKNFFGKEANNYDWRVFMFLGQSRGSDFFSYKLIGRVRFPKMIKDVKPGDTFDVEAIVLENPTAITISEANLPVAGLSQPYDLAAKEVFVEHEELIEPA